MHINNNIKEVEQLPPIPNNNNDDYYKNEISDYDLNFKTMELVFKPNDQMTLVSSNDHPMTTKRRTGHLKLVK